MYEVTCLKSSLRERERERETGGGLGRTLYGVCVCVHV